MLTRAWGIVLAADVFMAAHVDAKDITIPAASSNALRKLRKAAALQATAGLIQRLTTRILELEDQLAAAQAMIGPGNSDHELCGRLELAAPVFRAGIEGTEHRVIQGA